MREIDDIQATSGLPHRGWLLLAAFLLIGLGVALGGWLFPQQVIKLVTVEKEKRVEVPVDRIVEKLVPVERIVEKRVEVPVEVIKYLDRPVYIEKNPVYIETTPQAYAPVPPLQIWKQLRLGMTTTSVSALLGKPKQVYESGHHSSWYYGGKPTQDGWVDFRDGLVRSWGEPSR
jgi:hypothetical protein